MSRIARKPIKVPSGVEVKVDGTLVRVKGPRGELKRQIHESVNLGLGDEITVTVDKPGDQRQKAHWGTAASLIRSMIQGVTEGFEKILDINGVGYRAEVKGKSVNLSLGYSHPVVYPLPEGVSAQCPAPTQIVLSGADPQVVGQAAAEIRAMRPVEPYKGKGVMYRNEHVIRKEGKKAGR